MACEKIVVWIAKTINTAEVSASLARRRTLTTVVGSLTYLLIAIL